MESLASPQSVATITIVLGTCAFLAVPRLGPIPLSRSLTALVGAVLVVFVGAISPEAALAAIDSTTLLLLFGMMIHVEALAMSGFYDWAGPTLVNRTGTTRRLALGALGLAAALSAIALNDATVVLLTPVLIGASEAADADPTTPLVALVFGANIGSLATPLGNPQNAYILARSDLTTAPFVATLAPIALVCVGIAAILLLLVTDGGRLTEVAVPEFDHGWTAMSSVFLLGTFCLLVAFPNADPGFVATGTAICHLAVLQIVRRAPGSEAIERIDWGILVLFAGLFVLTGSLDDSAVTAVLEQVNGGLALVGATFVLSNLVSNVPAVILLSEAMSSDSAWLTLAAVSTLAGNATPIGSAVTLIVLEAAKRRGVDVSVWRLVGLGLPLSILTTAVAVLAL